MKRLRDPFTVGMALAVGLVAGGLVVLGYAWRGVARLLFVPLQMPYAASGGLAAIALIGLGLAIARVQTDRLHDARERHNFDLMLRDAARMIADARQGTTMSRVSE